MKAPIDASKITAAIAARPTAYQAKVQTALPVIRVARSIGCTTGLHYAAFLNIVGVPAFSGIIKPMPDLP